MTEARDEVPRASAPALGGRRSIARWAGRGLLSCVDQGVVSGANFGANILLARWLDPAEYGAFAVAFTLFLVASGFHNALLVDPACVLGPARFRDGLSGYFKKLVWLHAAWSAAASLGIAATALAVSVASLRRALYGLAAALPFLLLLWLLRRLCYVQAGPAAALLSSAAYAALLVAGLFLLRRWGAPSPCGALLVMAAASATASATVWSGLGLAGAGSGVRTTGLGELARTHWQYGKWLSATSVLNLGVTQLQTFLIAGCLGLAAAGSFRALFNFVQPMNQLTAAVAFLFLPNLSADFGAGRSGALRAKGALITSALTVFAGVYEIALLCWGPCLEEALYGGRFRTYGWLIPVMGLMPLFIALASGRSLVLQAIQKPQHYLIRGAVTGSVGVASALVLTAWAGLAGAAASMVLTLAASAVVTFRLYRRFCPAGQEGRT